MCIMGGLFWAEIGQNNEGKVVTGELLMPRFTSVVLSSEGT